MRRRKPAASTQAAAPQPARHRGRPPAAAPAPTQQQQPSTRQRRGAGCRQDAQPIQAPAKPGGKCKGPETGDPEMEETARRELVIAPPGGESFVSFCFCSAAGPAASGTKTPIKEQFPRSLGLKRRRVVDRASQDRFPPPLLPAGSSVLPKSTPPAHSWNQVRAVTLESPLHVVTRRAVTSLKPGSCVSSRTRRDQVSVTLHTQTLPSQARPSQAQAGSLCSTTLPHRGYVSGPAGSACTVSRSLASAPQSVSVAPADHQTWLRDSVCPASLQVLGHPVHFSQGRRCPLSCVRKSQSCWRRMR